MHTARTHAQHDTKELAFKPFFLRFLSPGGGRGLRPNRKVKSHFSLGEGGSPRLGIFTTRKHPLQPEDTFYNRTTFTTRNETDFH